MWRCDRCGRTFANRYQTHTCRPLGSLDAHFAGKDPAVRATFDRIVEVVQALEWARERVGSPLTVAGIAAHAAVSQATLHRRFQAELGTTPLAWLTRERVALACRLLERGEVRLEGIARNCGLGTAANLRIQLKRTTGLTPSEYRRRFALRSVG